jgi:hypothetical protein
MSTAKFNTWLNPDGTQNYKCRAWVNFNGTGTVAIRASGNVTSITDNGTGLYTVNFTTAMPDANYSFAFGGGNTAGNGNSYGLWTTVPTTTAIQMASRINSGNLSDQPDLSVIIFR